MKTIVYLKFLFVLLILSSDTMAQPGDRGASDAPSYQARIIIARQTSEGGNHRAVKVRPDDCLAFRFATARAFSQLGIVCPSYSDNVGALRLSLFRWTGTYEQTIAANPLARRQYDDFKDNQVLEIGTDSPQAAGVYLLTVDQGRQDVGVWVVPQSMSGTESYFNGQPLDGTPEVSFELLCHNSPVPFSGDLKAYERATSPSSCPPPVQTVPGDPTVLFDAYPDTYAATDDLGRSLPGFSEVGAVRPQKQVGIFYWTWHDTSRLDESTKVYNNTLIQRESSNARENPDDLAWGPWGSVHHWDQPLLGYYGTTDKWALRRHAQWLAAAQIDAVVFDCTNGTYTWMDSTRALLESWSQARRDGVNTPKIAFMLPFWNQDFNAIDLLQLYRDLYRDGKYQDLWFYWQGRPLVYGLPEAVDRQIAQTDGEQKAEWETIRRFFAFRPGQASYTGGSQRPDDWSWLEVYPQNGYGLRADGSFDMISVSVAQNHSENKRDGSSGLAAMNDQNVFGRAWVVGQPVDQRPDAYKYGGNFAQQWSRAYQLDPQFVFVTGWNEWIAGRFRDWMGTYSAYPDEFDERFSRDVEPSAGTLRDTYYNQLVAQVRRFKGVRPAPQWGLPVTIQLGAPARSESDPWKTVSPTFRDYRNDIGDRDARGYGRISYVNRSGRNDIAEAKIAYDDRFVYFMVETMADLTDRTQPDWMQLYIATSDVETVGKSNAPSWYGFQFIVNRTAPGEKAALERSLGGWSWERVAEVEYRVKGNRLEVAIERAALGLPDGGTPPSLRFKWADNAFRPGSDPNDGARDILDFYQYGDAAPDGRFMFRIDGKDSL